MSPKPTLNQTALSLLFFSASITHVLGSSNLTAYEVLEDYDFPIGLLPTGVTGYELNTTTGAFKVYLNETCTFTIGSYELQYRTTVTGSISTDKLTSLSGIKVKVWLLWLSIVEVVKDEDELEFSVGIASADFPVSNLLSVLLVGVGLIVMDWKVRKGRFRRRTRSS